jgi:hypothetical protein
MRQRELAACLQGHGIDVSTADGLNAWIPVHHEAHARITLAAHGIKVSGGSAFRVPADSAAVDAHPGPHQGDHIRVSVGALRDSIPAVAEAIAMAARET